MWICFLSHLCAKSAVLANLIFTSSLSYPRQTDYGMPIYFKYFVQLSLGGAMLTSMKKLKPAAVAWWLLTGLQLLADQALQLFPNHCSKLLTCNLSLYWCDEQCFYVPFHWHCCKGNNPWDTNISAIFWLAQLFLKWISEQSSVDVHIASLPAELHQLTKQHELSWQKFACWFEGFFLFASRLCSH